MAQITEKELAALGDLLTFEQLAIAKYTQAACNAQDTALSDLCNKMARRHQRHFDDLYSNLK